MLRLRLWLVLYLFSCQSFQVNCVNSTKTLKLASFNIRFGGPEKPTESRNFDQERVWYERRNGLVDQVIWEEPDIIGLQEVGNFSLG
jgi:hypothetical protein